MKKLFFMAAIAIAAVTANAQNIQLHYDFGRNIYPDEEAGRQKVTVTLEQFKADNLGSWYYFVDLDLSRKFFKSAYTEISREFNLGKGSPFAAHIEYDGGLSEAAGSFQQAALLGAAYNGHTADFCRPGSPDPRTPWQRSDIVPATTPARRRCLPCGCYPVPGP